MEEEIKRLKEKIENLTRLNDDQANQLKQLSARYLNLSEAYNTVREKIRNL